MATTQYIGARYVPLFAEPIEWDKTKQYEPLTIVTHEGNSYTSRQFVPTGIEITNEDFWALTGNFNAQVEQYRNEVKAYDGRITANANAIETETANRAAAVTAEMERAQSAERVLTTNLNAEVTRAESAEQTLNEKIGTSTYYISPCSFGAIGDGVNDDTAFVQQAIDSEHPVMIDKTFKVNHVSINKPKKIDGNGTIIGTIYLGSENEYESDIDISNITINGNVILNNYRSSHIDNVTFISENNYAIRRNENIPIKRHGIGYFEITNCVIRGKGFIYLNKKDNDGELPFNDISIIGCTANSITDFFFYSDLQDGCKIYNNKIQYPSYGSANKTSCIRINQGDFVSIVGNTIFETGEEAIILNKLNNSIVSSNNIGWCGEQKISPAIKINVGETLIPTHIVISDNSISYQSGYAIDIDNTRYATITGNTVNWSRTPPYLGKENCISDMSTANGSINYTDTLLYSVISGNSLEGCYMELPISQGNNCIRNNSTSIRQYFESQPVVTNDSVSSNFNVLLSNIQLLNPSSDFSIMSLNRYIEGEIIHLVNISEHNVTIKKTNNIKFNGATDIVLKQYDTITFIVHDGIAYASK